MNILIAGGSGFVGHSLSKVLSLDHDLTLLSRKKDKINSYYKEVLLWDDLSDTIMNKFNIVINLCGHNISNSRWSPKIKKMIISSRVKTTENLIKFIGQKNIWLINASAIGFYKFSALRQDEKNYLEIDQSNLSFCQQVTHKWEYLVTSSGLCKWTILRFGVVIGSGGMIDKLMPTVKLGLGAILGDGVQLVSWVSLNDLCLAIDFIIKKRIFFEALNITSPNPSSQKKLIADLCDVLNKPRWFKIHKKIVCFLFGEMGKELLLSQHNIYPQSLIDYGFKFQDVQIEECIKKIVGKDI